MLKLFVKPRESVPDFLGKDFIRSRFNWPALSGAEPLLLDAAQHEWWGSNVKKSPEELGIAD